MLAAARDVYAERGWSGFNFDVVAKAARVGKDALYRRFPDRSRLLVAAMRGADDRRLHENALEDRASIRQHLTAVGRDYFSLYTGKDGLCFMRLWVEQTQAPELTDAFHGEVSVPEVHRVRKVVRSAIDAGDLPGITSPTALLDGLVGGVLMHILATPPDLRVRMVEGAEAYVTELVNMLLRGAGYREDSSTS